MGRSDPRIAAPPEASTLRRRDRGQGGITLAETLVALAISTIIIGPVGAWMVLTFTTQAPAAAGLTDAGQSRLLDTYVTRDVASAEIVVAAATDPPTTPPPDVAGCTGTGVDDRIEILNVEHLNSDERFIVYGVGDSPGGRSRSLYRWVCDRTSAHNVEQSTEVLRDVESVTATCDLPEGCAVVTVEAKFADSGYVTTVTATRRSSSVEFTGGSGGNAAPQPIISQVSRTERSPSRAATEVELVVDPNDDGGSHTFSWSVSGPGSATLSPDDSSSSTFSTTIPGDYIVSVRVEDDGGLVGRASLGITVTNRPPEIDDAACAPVVADPGRYSCSASASDPDSGSGFPSDAFDWEWPTDGAGGSQRGSGNPLAVTIPPTLGNAVVILTVSDRDGGTAIRYVSIVPPGPAPEGGIDISPDLGPVEPGRPPLLLSTDGDPGSRTARFSARGSDTTGLRLIDVGGSAVADSSGSGTPAELVHTFPPNSSGTFEIQRLTAGGPAESRTFRVNAPPTAAFVVSDPQGPAPQTLTFTDTSSDDWGIATRLWTFDAGFPLGPAAQTAGSTATWTVTQPGSYVVTLRVTDLDGREATTFRTVTVGGTPAVPDPPTWEAPPSNRVTFPPVRGATAYTVRFTHTGTAGDGATPCVNTVNVSVDADGPFRAVDTGNTCPIPAATEASLAVRAGSAASAFSTPVLRP